MRLEHGSEEQLKKNIAAIMRKYLDSEKYKVFFFGSRVSGHGDERSDIDIGIEGQEPVPVNEWLNIEEELQNLPTLYSIDIVDFKRVSKKFKNIALQNYEPIII